MIHALAFLLLLPNLAIAAPTKSPGGIRFAPENRQWRAGSEQKIRIDGRATEGASVARYRWISASGAILDHGKLTKGAKGGFEGQVRVPRFAMKSEPKLVLQVDREAPRETSIFRSGKEFTPPKITGLVTDTAKPRVLDQAVTQWKKNFLLEVALEEPSGVKQTMLLMKNQNKTELVNGECRPKEKLTVCAYLTKQNPAKTVSQVRFIDGAGNRSIASVKKGALR